MQAGASGGRGERRVSGGNVICLRRFVTKMDVNLRNLETKVLS
jgi:hypothetical protein